MITDLDLSLVDLQNNNDISRLHNSRYLNNGSPLGTLVLPESLTSFPTGALDNNTSTWTTIVFPNATKPANESSTVIAGGAFTSIKSIKNLVIGTSVKTIGKDAFSGCTNITSLDLLYGVTKIDGHAFNGCTGLTRVVLPESLVEIGEQAFGDCSSMTSIRLPNSLQYIRKEAFANCSSLTQIVIPENVEQIERGAFDKCYALTDVYVLGTHTKCANQAFMPTDMTYGYSYDGPGKGETVDISQFFSKRGTYTRLHYPDDAYETYVNLYTRLIGTDAYNQQSTYSAQNNKWVYDTDGNKWPVLCDDYFEGYGGDYAGWWNFMLPGKIKGTYVDERLLDSKWYSVCFPFALTSSQIGYAFGNATEVCEFSGANIMTDENSDKYLRLEFRQPVTEMKAHHPYMIHPGVHNAEYNILVDVSIDDDTDGDNFRKKLLAESVTPNDQLGNKYTFIGNHTEGAQVPRYSYYYYSGEPTDQWPNAFYKAMRSDVVFTPHTAVVQLEKDNGIGGAKASVVYFAEDADTGGVTSISTFASTTRDSLPSHAVYDLQGRKVAESGSASQLKPGIYIVNGKKFVNKQ